MPELVRATVTLTSTLSSFIDERVASGDYKTTSEVIRDALRMLKADHERKAARGKPAGSPESACSEDAP